MQAIAHDGWGGPDRLEIRDVDAPTAADDEVLIAVHAASVNPADWFMMLGEPWMLRLGSALRPPRAAIPGRAVAGRVEAVGSGVTGFRPGDEVIAETAGGGFAELVAVRADRAAPKPSRLTFEEAATVPLAATTALQGLRDAGRLTAGHHVLINGASGGIGTFAVQIAAALGAEITAVCSARNLELVTALGADHVIDYASEDVTRTDRRFDVAFDLVGNHTLSDWLRVLPPGGTLVLSAGRGNRVVGPLGRVLAAVALSPFVAQRLVPLFARPGRADLVAVTELIETGAVTPVIDQAHTLERAAEAMRHQGEGHARGKTVVTVRPRVEEHPAVAATPTTSER